MAKSIFLFNGGNYKIFTDDGRLRVPLTQEELDMVFYDPEVPNDTDNSIGTELDMGVWKEALCDLEVDDEIFLALVPDATLVRGLWAMSFDAIDGFTVEFDLIQGSLVAENMLTGDGLALGLATSGSTLAYDFTNGLGDATCDAVTKAGLPWGSGVYGDYRNPEALQGEIFDPALFLKLGMAMYIRMKVVALGDLNGGDGGCCNKCNKPTWPTFQIGAIYDRLCADKQRTKKFCNCDLPCGCAGDCEPADPAPIP